MSSKKKQAAAEVKVAAEKTTEAVAIEQTTEAEVVAEEVTTNEQAETVEQVETEVKVEEAQVKKVEKYTHLIDELNALVKQMNHENRLSNEPGLNRYRFISFMLAIIDLPEEAPERIRDVLEIFNQNSKTSLSHTRMLTGLNGGLMQPAAYAEAVAIFNFMSRMCSPETRYKTALSNYDWAGLEKVMLRNPEGRIASLRAACNV